MKVKELIKELSTLPGELEVFFYLQNIGIYESGVGSITVEERDESHEISFIPPDDTATYFVEVRLG
jgi:hypothetical protein